jgi:hypothetical protein
LTDSAEFALAESLPGDSPKRTNQVGRLQPGTLLKITFDDPRVVLFRTFDDRAPEADARLDIFNPLAFDHRIPDQGNVEVVS